MRARASRLLLRAAVLAAIGAGALVDCALPTAGRGPIAAPCATAADCPDDGNRCTIATCENGFCANAIDPNAAPDDANDCTADACQDGIEQHPPKPDGTSCLAGKGTCAAGTCVVSCTGDAICDDMNPCTSDSCNGATHQCAWTPIDGPTPGVADVLGDCRRDVCIAGVRDAMHVDDSDVPSVAVCHTSACVNGTPQTGFAASGSSCGTSVVCDGMGNCVGCTDAAQCDASNPCTAPSCSSNQCTYAPTPAGTACTGPGGATVCDGAGTCVPCNVNADCPVGDPCNGTPTCANHACVPGTPVVCSPTAPCTKAACVGGSCQSSPAADGSPCDDGNACNGVDSCVGGQCISGTKTCDDGNECTMDACIMTGCTHTAVADGTSCGPSVCVGSTITGLACQTGSCNTVLTNCPGAYACFDGSTCQSCMDGKKDGNETDIDCGGGTPCPTCGSGKACKTTPDCTAPLTCKNGKCG